MGEKRKIDPIEEALIGDDSLGIGVSYPSFIDQDHVRKLAESKPADFAVAQAIHNEVIKSKIIKVPLPLLDADDTGLPVQCVGLHTSGMHSGSPCQYCGEQLVDSTGKPVTFPVRQGRGPNSGRKFSLEHKKKLSDSHRGQVPWNKGKNVRVDS